MPIASVFLVFYYFPLDSVEVKSTIWLADAQNIPAHRRTRTTTKENAPRSPRKSLPRQPSPQPRKSAPIRDVDYTMNIKSRAHHSPAAVAAGTLPETWLLSFVRKFKRLPMCLPLWPTSFALSTVFAIWNFV